MRKRTLKRSYDWSCVSLYVVYLHQKRMSHLKTTGAVGTISESFREYLYDIPRVVQQFWISREPFAWPSCNLSASQRRPYCESVNSNSSVGLVSRQWDSVDRACVLCDRRIHNDRASRSASSRRSACPFYSSCAGFFWQNITSPSSVSPPTAQIWLPATSGFSQS